MSNLKSDAVFKRIQDGVKENIAKAKSVNGVFSYKITQNGKVVKEWSKCGFDIRISDHCWDWTTNLDFVFRTVLDLKNGEVYEGPAKNIKVDTTLTVSDDDMVEISLGKLNPQAAFMKGKLKIAGNIMLTQKLVPLLKTESKL